MSEISTRELRTNLAKYIDAAESGEQVIILRDGTPAAALVPLSVVEAVDDAEDEMLAREAVARLAAGEKTSSMAEVLADIFEARK
ncbi:type II toxin-antitoxin system prevent-host-death family antitoxin [Nocardia colli]|uniref:Antitoxin n=1 Tax=Nocardia colli TaxID=2545717 RepID=A0A5N0EBG8_9NOCA|nr:type II toxin-antitoxin system prevent-host-death family antitoxin [Nocardia colli]KAA8886752.1 type II toxin-antitoxin system prevent-host-death family antitoxin [Nocardia colli]